MARRTKEAEGAIVVVNIDLDKLGDDWSELIGIGLTLSAAHDNNRWLLGDLAQKVARRYDESSLAKFAQEIGREVVVMYQYHAVSKFYSTEDRAAFPNLQWTHFRAAMACKDHDMAMTWLGKASDFEWVTAALSEAMKSPDGEPAPREVKLAQFAGEYVMSEPSEAVNEDGTAQYYLVTYRTTSPLALTPQRVYTVKVHGIREKVSEDGE